MFARGLQGGVAMSGTGTLSLVSLRGSGTGAAERTHTLGDYHEVVRDYRELVELNPDAKFTTAGKDERDA